MGFQYPPYILKFTISLYFSTEFRIKLKNISIFIRLLLTTRQTFPLPIVNKLIPMAISYAVLVFLSGGPEILDSIFLFLMSDI